MSRDVMMHGAPVQDASAPAAEQDRATRSAPVTFDVRREFLRCWRLGFAITIGAYLVAAGICVSIAGVPVMVAYLGLVPISPLAAAVTWWLLGRRLFPGSDAIRWVERDTEVQLARVLGEPPVSSAEAALQRLEGRTDPEAVGWRARLRAQTGPPDELRVALTEWQPADPVDAVRRARAESQLTLMEGTDDGLRGAWQAASGLADADRRAEEQARVLVDEAGRAAATRRDPWPTLADAGRALGPRLDEARTPEDVLARRTLRRSLATRSLIPSVVILVFLLLVSIL